MRKSKLRSTTSLVVSLSLITSPIMAQQTAVEGEPLALCAGLQSLEGALDLVTGEGEAELVLPCLDANGEVIEDQEALAAALEAQGEVETTTAAEPAVEDAPVEEVVVEEAPAEEPVAEVEDPAVVEETAETQDAVEEEPIAEVEGEAEAEITPDIAADAETATEVEAEAEVAPEVAAEAEVEITPETEAEVGADIAVEDEAEAETQTEAETTEDAPVVAEGLPEGDDAVEIADTPVVEEEAPAAAAAAAADNDVNAEADPTAEVQVEELTDDDVRTSDEDFDTSAASAAPAVTSSESDDDDNLTNFQRALLLGLGAVVVGSVMNNGDEVVSNSGDRVVVERDGELIVLKDDDVLLRQPGSQVRTENFSDGSTRTVVTRESGDRIVTIRASDGRVLRRTRILQDGTEFVLFDDTQQFADIEVTELPEEPQDPVQMQVSRSDVESLRIALMANQNANSQRSYSLRQIRQIREVRALAPEVELDIVTFASGSAAIDPSQAEELTGLGVAISNIISDDPGQVFLIEGHTDAVGDAGYNLALSDRRAETVALAMTEYFGIPPENLITQGYGESILKVQTLGDERANRRASVRNITSLLR